MNREQRRNAGHRGPKPTGPTQGFWNGLPTRVRKVVGTVPMHDPATDPPLAWWKDIAGQRIEAVEVVLDGVNYGGGTTYLDDRDGTGWRKVTIGHGSPRYGHREINILGDIVDRDAERNLVPAGDHPALPDKKSGVHRWVRSSAYYLTPQQAAAAASGAHVELGSETLIRYGVGCLDCAAPFDQAKDLPCEVDT